MRTKFSTRTLLVLVCATASLAGRAHAQTPYLLKDVNPGSQGSDPSFAPPYARGVAGDHLIFGAFRPDVGREPWSTLGTEASTLPLDLTPGPTSGFWQRIVPAGERFTFGLGSDLWSTDGTPGGTQPIAPSIVATNDRVATNGGIGAFASGHDLFRTDGTTAGTFRVAPPAGVGSATNPWNNGLVGYASGFAAWREPRSVWLWGREDERATLLIEGCWGGLGAEERLFLSCYDGVTHSLWASDGSRAGTHRLLDLPGLQGIFVASEGRIYFPVYSTFPDPQLWTSDGTAAGTHPVTSTVPFPAGFGAQGFTASNGIFYFGATTPAAGRELWRTDGTTLGTFMLRDVEPGPASGINAGIPLMVAANGGVVFVGSNADRGTELWHSDGTTAGTVPLPEIVPGPASSVSTAAGLANHRGRVYFVADDGVHGFEPWALDLPSAVSVADVTVTEGDGGTTTASFELTLYPASTTAVTVAYATAAGSASAGSDFVATAGVLTFAPGQTQASVEVSVVGDDADERTEAFALEVLPMAGVATADGRGAAVVLDDDAPRIAVAGASVVEGNAGPTDAVFPVTLTTGDGQPTTNAITVRAEVEYGTADAADFPAPRPPFPPAPAPSVTFPAGSASGTTLSLNVAIQGDTLDEPNETFALAFDAGNDAELPENGTVTGVILDDDGIAAAAPVEIAHGSRVLADLAPPAGRASDVDFYALRHDLHSSYEIVVDGVSGDATPLQVERVVASGSVFQTALPTGTGNSVALRFFGLGVSTDHIRVRSAACGTTCGADDVYRLRMYETTLRSPRVNTVGGQATALVIQNTTDLPIAAVAAYWSAGGLMSSVQPFDVPAHGTTVVDPAAVLPEFAGSLTVGHNGPYGGLVGKVVSIDPATGFSFESPLTSKPR